MEAPEPEALDQAVESRLRSAQPRPRPEFMLELRERLLPERAVPRWRRRPRPALVAALGASTAAAAVLVLSLAGTGPLAGNGGGGQDVKAKSNCRFVLVKGRGRVPVVVRGPDGTTRIVYRDEPVERPVERCR